MCVRYISLISLLTSVVVDLIDHSYSHIVTLLEELPCSVASLAIMNPPWVRVDGRSCAVVDPQLLRCCWQAEQCCSQGRLCCEGRPPLLCQLPANRLLHNCREAMHTNLFIFMCFPNGMHLVRLVQFTNIHMKRRAAQQCSGRAELHRPSSTAHV